MKLLQGKERRCCSVTHTTPFCQRSERVCDLLIWCNFMYCCFPELFFCCCFVFFSCNTKY